jgi:hypothetical protein
VRSQHSPSRQADTGPPSKGARRRSLRDIRDESTHLNEAQSCAILLSIDGFVIAACPYPGQRLSVTLEEAGLPVATMIERRMRQVDILSTAAALIDGGEIDDAVELCRESLIHHCHTLRFPLAAGARLRRAGEQVVPPADVPQRIRVACRDGFVDRYSPERWRLLNPGAVRVLNLLMGDSAVPTTLSNGTPRSYRGNTSVWWDSWPTVDHRLPRARRGDNSDDNLLCTSWWRNDTKKDANVAETGWIVQPPRRCR